MIEGALLVIDWLASSPVAPNWRFRPREDARAGES